MVVAEAILVTDAISTSFDLYKSIDLCHIHKLCVTVLTMYDWKNPQGLPTDKFALGVPLYGTNAAGVQITYFKLIDMGADPKGNGSFAGYSYDSQPMLQEQVDLAINQSLGGLMCWHLGSDLPPEDTRSLTYAIKQKLKPGPRRDPHREGTAQGEAYSVRELVPWPRFLSTVPTKRWVTQLGSPCGHPGLLLADLPNVQLTREGMAVNGRYRPGGRGDFTVAYLANPVFPQTLDVRRFRRGVRTRRSTAVDVTELNQWCGFYLAPQATIAHLGPCGDLLAICQWFPDETPGPNPRRAAVPVWVYTGNTFYTFFIEATFAYNPTGVAELSNGDIIIASVVYSNPTKLRISYITSDQLNKDIDDRFRRISPLVIADIDQADGFEIGVQSGLAVREDPRSGRIFVYSMSDDSFTPGRTLLTTFEWEPIRNPRS
ncbi:hypothetical protein FOL46_007502 [Perkinsus olseni]|uniref:Chitinase n=1 Tax=Perkinsus olseni TaxID=32597 RepID=A0A7J6LDA8_PEROL|nr:hypothetical protein FOL46_007502 [Perkinsus olseni]